MHRAAILLKILAHYAERRQILLLRQFVTKKVRNDSKVRKEFAYLCLVHTVARKILITIRPLLTQHIRVRHKRELKIKLS